MTWAFSCLGSLFQKKQKDPITLILSARSLVPSSGGDGKCWAFVYEETSGGEKIEVAKLKKTNGQLNVRGAVSTADLTAGVEYEVVFRVKLKKGGCGWEHPVIVILSVPGEQRDVRRRRQVDLCGQQREDGGWIELNVGDFTPESAGTGQVVSFHLLQEGEHEKKGLLLQSAVVRPKSTYRRS